MTGIKMSDVFDLPMDTESSCGQKFLCDKEYRLADFCDDLTYGDKRGAAMAKAAAKAINAYDDNQERIRHLISCGNELEHVIDMQRERIDLFEGEFKRICDANALLENQLENAIAEISELKKKARGY
ncbi:MAG: hypothetical protein ACPG8A_13140 [Psychrobium sp.]